MNNKKKVYWGFYNTSFTGGISGARRHQLGIRGDVAPCRKRPLDVRAHLQADLDEK
jgi:hypothetical protein